MRKALSFILALTMALAAGAQEPDKPALEKFFMDGLASYDAPLERPIPDNLQRIDRNLYVSDFGYYETEAVRAVSYFIRKKDSYIPLRDPGRPAESVVTLLSGYTGSSHYTVSLKQHRYNYALEEVDLPLNRLLGFCIIGCSFFPYVGIEQVDDRHIRATLFLVNEELGYSHTILFDLDRELLGRDSGQLQAEAYTFTPIHKLAK